MTRRVAAKTLLATVIAVVLIGGLVFYDRDRQFGGSSAAVPPATPVTVASAYEQQNAALIEAVGTVVADRQVQLSAEVPGRVIELALESGREVSAGEILVRQNDEPLVRALEGYRARMAFLAKEVERGRSLGDRAISRSALDDRERRYNEARADAAEAEAQIAQHRIRAPFDGVLGIRRVNLGQYLEAGDPVATLVNTAVKHIDFTVPDRHLRQISVGQKLKVFVDSDSETALDARISAIDPLVDPAARALAVRATFADHHPELQPGVYASVRLSLSSDRQYVTVPATAVQRSLDGEYVYVVVDDEAGGHRAERRAVVTNGAGGSSVGIETGLKTGDRVVLSGHLNIGDGSIVRIQNDSAAGPFIGEIQ